MFIFWLARHSARRVYARDNSHRHWACVACVGACRCVRQSYFFNSFLGSSFFFAPQSFYPSSAFSGYVAAILIVTLPGVRPAPTLSPPGLPPATRATACFCFFVRSSRRWARLAARCVFCLCVVALASLALRFRIFVGDCSTSYISCCGLMLNSHELVNTRPRRTHAVF